MAGFVTVAKVGDVKPGTLKSFVVDSKRILIANWEGTLFATQDLCTHDKGHGKNKPSHPVGATLCGRPLGAATQGCPYRIWDVYFFPNS